MPSCTIGRGIGSSTIVKGGRPDRIAVEAFAVLGGTEVSSDGSVSTAVTIVRSSMKRAGRRRGHPCRRRRCLLRAHHVLLPVVDLQVTLDLGLLGPGLRFLFSRRRRRQHGTPPLKSTAPPSMTMSAWKTGEAEFSRYVSAPIVVVPGRILAARALKPPVDDGGVDAASPMRWTRLVRDRGSSFRWCESRG